MLPRSSESRRPPAVGSPLEWNVVERCRVVTLLTFPFYFGYGFRADYVLRHPEIEPFFDRAWLEVMRNGLAAAVLFWVLYLAYGSIERRRPGAHRAYVLVGSLSWWMATAGIGYLLGPVTSPAWIAILIGVVATTLMLPRGAALTGIGFGLCLVVASQVAVGLGLVPYAPLMAAPVAANGHIELSNLIGATSASVLSTLALLGVVQYMMTRWRDANAHLERLNANLEQIVAERTRELVASQAQLRRVEKMEAVGRLAGGIAHDFNNLLAVIIGYADMLLAREDAAPLREEVAEIKSAGGNAARLVAQLLAVGRRQVMELEPLRLDDVVRDAADLLRPLVGEDVELRLRLSDDLGLVEADRVQMQQVMLNLATNARDAMPRGGTLTLETANLDVAATLVVGTTAVPPGAWVTLGVTDTGEGMDRERQERAFEPFYTTKRPGRGTGLGLSSVYGIVEQSGGLVSVESSVGEGSSFCIYLPRLPATAKVAVPAAPASAPSVRRATVLLVEDDSALRRLLRRTLAAQRHTVLEAADPFDALEQAKRHGAPLDVVLTDVVMPRGSGRELAEELLKDHPEARVIFMTGYTDDAVLLRGVFAQEVKLLRKPFPLAALGAALAEVLGRPDEA